MDVRDLRYIRVLAEHGNFSRAADALGLTQPALTRRVQALEAELEVRLFDRHPKGVDLTSFGKVVVARAADLLQGVDNVKLELDRMRGLDVGHVGLGAGPVVAQTIVGEAIGRLLHNHPKLKVSVYVGSVEELTSDLRATKTDMFIGDVTTIAGDKDLAIVSSFEHSGYFFCRPGHPILKRRPPTAAEIFSYPFVSVHLPPGIAQRFAESIGHPLKPTVECDNYAVLKNIVATSDAISLGSRYAIIDDLRSGRLVEVPTLEASVVNTFGVVRLANRQPSPAAIALADELAESARTVVRWSSVSTRRTGGKRVKTGSLP